MDAKLLILEMWLLPHIPILCWSLQSAISALPVSPKVPMQPPTDSAIKLLASNSTSFFSPYIKYHVPDSSPSLDLIFWKYGASIPEIELLIALAKVGSFAYEKVAQNGSAALDHGFLRSECSFQSTGDRVHITICDHSEIGRPMSWFMVRDTVMGIGLFLNDHKNTWTEVSFWVELAGELWDVGFGNVALVNNPRKQTTRCKYGPGQTNDS